MIRKNGLTVKLDVQCVQRQEQADDEETEESVEQSIERQVPKAGVLRNSLADFYVYFQNQPECRENVISALALIEKQIKRSESKRIKQTAITDFFQKMR